MKAFRFNNKELKVAAITSGNLIELSNGSDEVFAMKMMGEGYAINPSITHIAAPFDGRIAFVFPTKHAIGVISNQGIEALIHVGIDTVKLQGECFEVHVTEGESVKTGDLLMTVDFDEIRNRSYLTTTIVVFTNTHIQDITHVKLKGDVIQGDTVLKVKIR